MAYNTHVYINNIICVTQRSTLTNYTGRPPNIITGYSTFKDLPSTIMTIIWCCMNSKLYMHGMIMRLFLATTVTLLFRLSLCNIGILHTTAEVLWPR